ncbi:hypothetical protein [Halorhodospira neutriphila]|uniref:hypothetical protein n=1 Tax=Halorhodospira neutriphila TaxID=168379 RepID=UPI00190362F5|nr:hypothetical protein [Halorhodospira neutriphila]
MIQIGARGASNRTTNTAEMTVAQLRSIADGETNHRARDRKRAHQALQRRGWR